MITCDIRRLDLERRSASGECHALETLFDDVEPRLAKIARFRMPAEFRNRVSLIELLSVSRVRALRRQSEFVIEAGASSFLWFRGILLQTIEQMRVRFAPCCDQWLPVHSSLLKGMGDSVLSQLSDVDLQILFLRHFEELTNEEAAVVIGIVPQGLSLRYIQILNQVCDIEHSDSHFEP